MPLSARALCGRHDTESERRASSQKVAGHSHAFPPRAEHYRSRDGRRGPWGEHRQNHVFRYPINKPRAPLILDQIVCTHPLVTQYHVVICSVSWWISESFAFFPKLLSSDTATEWAFVVHAHGDGAVRNRTPPPCFAKPSYFPVYVYSPAGTLESGEADIN